jgi:hypothetical protein
MPCIWIANKLKTFYIHQIKRRKSLNLLLLQRFKIKCVNYVCVIYELVLFCEKHGCLLSGVMTEGLRTGRTHVVWVAHWRCGLVSFQWTEGKVDTEPLNSNDWMSETIQQKCTKCIPRGFGGIMRNIHRPNVPSEWLQLYIVFGKSRFRF